ncbi:hypothetical protein ACJ73_10171 [Blastomyces percursus]|uniref:Uncharacterized protein n=1 Tax=Blastomyces percursus TaxID=1658174 RepID=A0A1J9P089_9EURO|nr:hypothetical protein ACJ73_10171 [Blastomyces percursus]
MSTTTSPSNRESENLRVKINPENPYHMIDNRSYDPIHRDRRYPESTADNLASMNPCKRHNHYSAMAMKIDRSEQRVQYTSADEDTHSFGRRFSPGTQARESMIRGLARSTDQQQDISKQRDLEPTRSTNQGKTHKPTTQDRESHAMGRGEH